MAGDDDDALDNYSSLAAAEPGEDDNDISVNLEEFEERMETQATSSERSSSIAHILRSLFEMRDATSTGNSTTAQQEPTAQNAADGERTLHLSGLTFEDLLRLLGGTGSHGASTTRGRVSYSHHDEEEEDGDEDDDYYRAGWNTQWFPPVTEPQEAGVDLLMSGEFGRVRSRLSNLMAGQRNIARLVMDRATHPYKSMFRQQCTTDLVPNTNGTAVVSYGANIYSGQFSKDSSFYYTCCQDFRLHVYDMTSRPTPHKPTPSARGEYPERDHVTTLKVLKTIQGVSGRWTITDSHLSPDNERMIYSTISPTVYMTSTLDGSPEQIPIRFADRPRRGAPNRRFYDDYDDDSFGIWSCRFSADGNEVIAGGSGHIFVYDLLADRRTVKIAAHNDDVNSCCWADTASGNVLISASDDTFIKVWDRRSLGASNKPSGVLVGHTEGITNVSAKGDGRYIISNGKDQALRLWDLRKMHTSDEFDAFARKDYRARGYDYRYGHYPKPKRDAHPQDCSVMTYRGHAVLRTLIRCRFSPAETTGGQYIYSGSADGRIHIWSLDGRIVQILDRSQTLPMSFDPSAAELEPRGGRRSSVCVRDVSWHTHEPVLMSAGWEGDRSGGSMVARHEWKGLGKMRLEDWEEKRRQECRDTDVRRSRRLSQHVPGAFLESDSEKEDEC